MQKKMQVLALLLFTHVAPMAAQEVQEGSMGQLCQISWADPEERWWLQLWEQHSAKMASFVLGCLGQITSLLSLENLIAKGLCFNPEMTFAMLF